MDNAIPVACVLVGYAYMLCVYLWIMHVYRIT